VDPWNRSEFSHTGAFNRSISCLAMDNRNVRSTVVWAQEARLEKIQKKKKKKKKERQPKNKPGKIFEELFGDLQIEEETVSKGIVHAPDEPRRNSLVHGTNAHARVNPKSITSADLNTEERINKKIEMATEYYTSTNAGSVWSQIGDTKNGATFVEFYRPPKTSREDEGPRSCSYRKPASRQSRFDKRSCGLCGYKFPSSMLKEQGYKATRQAIHMLRLIWIEEGRHGSEGINIDEFKKAYNDKFKLARKYDSVTVCAFCNQFFPVQLRNKRSASPVRTKARVDGRATTRAGMSSRKVINVVKVEGAKPASDSRRTHPVRYMPPDGPPSFVTSPHACRRGKHPGAPSPPSLPKSLDIMERILKARSSRTPAPPRDPRTKERVCVPAFRSKRVTLLESIRMRPGPESAGNLEGGGCSISELNRVMGTNVDDVLATFLVSPVVRAGKRVAGYPSLPKRMNLVAFREKANAARQKCAQ